jgi:hypothetical protein
MRRAFAAAALALLLVSAGCADLIGYNRGAPQDDRLGWEDGYWYDQPLDIETEDGLNASERRAVVGRAMARVERIRGLEFQRRVPVEVVTRAEYQRQRGDDRGTEDGAFNAWNNQVWEALFLVDEETDVSDSFETVYGTSVTGFYSPGEDRIVIVADSETPLIDRRTLSHELVHALQDQHLSLGPGAKTQDAQLASDGLVEGDANLVEQLYEDRCAGDWQCLPIPPRASDGGGGEFNQGVFQAVFTPYAEGPHFVADIRQRGGWEAVNGAYEEFPESTEQVIHPATYPDEDPVEVTVPNRARGGWERFDVDPEADTVGEASIYAMVWANGLTGEHDRYNYSYPISDGWAGDSLVPYHNGDETGYVWKIQWDTEDDAREFLAAYRDLLAQHNATRDGNVYVVPEGDPYADAFRVFRNGKTVTIVNGPDPAALDEIHG